jgi:hypothetical protein
LAVSNIIPTFAAPKLNLMYNSMSNIESTKGEIVMYQPDETIRLEYARDLSPRTTEEHQINPYPVVMTARFFCFFHSITV